MEDILERTNLKQTIILESMTLPERIELYKQDVNFFVQNEDRSAEAIAQWKHCLGLQLEDALDVRLQDLGICEEDLQCVLGDFSEQVSAYMTTPLWWEICDQVHTSLEGFVEGELPSATFLSSKDEDSIPYEHVFVTWVDVATERLRKEVPNIESIIGDLTLRKEQRGLLENLCTLSRSTEVNYQLAMVQLATATGTLMGHSQVEWSAADSN